jgi:hypothetical protein
MGRDGDDASLLAGYEELDDELGLPWAEPDSAGASTTSGLEVVPPAASNSVSSGQIVWSPDGARVVCCSGRDVRVLDADSLRVRAAYLAVACTHTQPPATCAPARLSLALVHTM